MKSSAGNDNLSRAGIILLTVITSLVHFYLNVAQGKLDIMFTLNGFGYLVLLAALFIDIPLARDNRRLIRWVMIGFTAVTIVAWLILGDKGWWLGWFDKLVEIGLIVLLLRKKT